VSTYTKERGSWGSSTYDSLRKHNFRRYFPVTWPLADSCSRAAEAPQPPGMAGHRATLPAWANRGCREHPAALYGSKSAAGHDHQAGWSTEYRDANVSYSARLGENGRLVSTPWCVGQWDQSCTP